MSIKIFFFFFIILITFYLNLSKPAKYRNKVIADVAENLCVCGLPTTTPMPDARVLNGSKVIGFDWEWTVGIYHKKKKDVICTGSLLSADTVLTAAHCLETLNRHDISVLAGFVHNWELMVNTTWGEKNVSYYMQHHLYNHIKLGARFLYDIAIIRLEDKFEIGFNNSISLACILNNTLPEPSTRDYFFAGYGITWPYISDKKTDKPLTPLFMSDGLRQITLNYDYWFCKFLGLEETNLCFRTDHGSLCDGDSGGGLYVHDSDKRLALVGVHGMALSEDQSNRLSINCFKQASSVSVMLSLHLEFIFHYGHPSCVLNSL